MTGILRAIARHPSGRIGAAIIVIYILAALLGALGLTPHDPLQQFRIDRLKGPSGSYLMGTDLLGRDSFSRLMLGIGQSFTIAFSSVALATLAGTVIGLVAAWLGHLWDGVLMRVMDVLLAFPAILLAMLIVAIAGKGTLASVSASARVYTPSGERVGLGPALALM